MIPNKNLLEILIQRGKLTSTIAEKILKEAQNLNRPAELILTERKILSEKDIAEAKSEYFKIPLKIFDPEETIDREVLNLIPEEVAKTHQVIPFKKEGETLSVGMVHPDDLRAQEILRFVAKQKKLNIAVYLITPSDLANLIKNYRTFETRLKEITEAVEIFKKQAKTAYVLPQQKIIKLEEATGVIAEEAPIIKLVSSILQQGVRFNASDIHIEPQRGRLRVRYRIDGELKEMIALPLEIHPPVITRVKILADLKIDETRIPQDGRFRTIIDEKEIDFRVSTFPTSLGEKVAIRILDPSIGLKTIHDLGMNEYHTKIIEETIEKPFGMILATGPTGCGKTTTLYALLQNLNKEDVNIVSLEDPIEYFIEGINQSQVRPEIGYDFASGLRQILRQDPDIIMVGEIRDNETAALAVHAALTGHLVLSTLHTNNALGVIPRLIDMKVEPFLLPASLILMLAQRLVGRLCDKCKKKTTATGSLLEIIKENIESLPPEIKKDFSEPYEIYLAQGCEECNFKGTKGRIGIFEMIKMTPELEEAVLKNPSESNLNQVVKNQGVITLRQDGIIKALKGLVSVEEVIKETV